VGHGLLSLGCHSQAETFKYRRYFLLKSKKKSACLGSARPWVRSPAPKKKRTKKKRRKKEKQEEGGWGERRGGRGTNTDNISLVGILNTSVKTTKMVKVNLKRLQLKVEFPPTVGCSFYN